MSRTLDIASPGASAYTLRSLDWLPGLIAGSGVDAPVVLPGRVVILHFGTEQARALGAASRARHFWRGACMWLNVLTVRNGRSSGLRTRPLGRLGTGSGRINIRANVSLHTTISRLWHPRLVDNFTTSSTAAAWRSLPLDACAV